MLDVNFNTITLPLVFNISWPYKFYDYRHNYDEKLSMTIDFKYINGCWYRLNQIMYL